MAAEIVLGERFPLAGEALPVRIVAAGRPVAGAWLEVRYRPNGAITFSEFLGPADELGEVMWTPIQAGSATLVAHEGTRMGPELGSLGVEVGAERFPGRARALMIAAAVLLFGGAASGSWMLLRRSRGAPAGEPPAT